MVRAPVVPDRPLTQGSLVSIEEAIGETARAFHAAEAALTAELERITEILALDPDSTRRYRREQVRGLLTRIGAMRADLEGRAVTFAEESLAKVYADGMLRTDRMYREQRLALGGQPSWTAVHREALEMLAVDAFDDLAGATSYMEAQAKSVIRKATKARTALSVVAGTDVRQDTRALVRTLVRDGVTGFVDAAGRSWRLGTYAEMVLRTKSAHAYNTGTVLRAEETGTRVMVISDGRRSGHAACAQYDGRTCSTRWALDHPIEHPNCVRSFGPRPTHEGEPELGSEAESATAAARREVARRQEAGDLPSDLTLALPDLPGGSRGSTPSPRTRPATPAPTGRQRPGEPVASRPRPPWSPAMPREDAEAFARGSVFTRDVQHTTTASSAAGIRSSGFDLTRNRFGRVWGHGVYVATDEATSAMYRSWITTRTTDEAVTLTLKVNVRKVVTLDATEVDATEGVKAALRKVGAEDRAAEIRQADTAARKAFRDSYVDPVTGVPWADRPSGAGGPPGQRARNEYMTRYTKAETDAIPKVDPNTMALQELGYDAIEIVGENIAEDAYSGGLQLVVFDPRRVVVIEE